MSKSFLFKHTRLVVISADSHHEAVARAERDLGPGKLEPQGSFDAPSANLPGEVEGPEFVGPYPTNTVDINKGTPYSFLVPATYYIIYTTAAGKRIVGPPPLESDPTQTITIAGTSDTFKLPAYARVFKILKLAGVNADGGAIYYIFVSVAGPDGNLYADTCWSYDNTLTEFYDATLGTVKPGDTEMNWR